MSCSGKPVEFELNSADASTAAALVLREAGARTSVTLGAEDRLIIQALTAHVVTATYVNIIADTDEDGDLDAGDLMVVLSTGNNSVDLSGSTGGGIAGAKGVMPKVLAQAAGQVFIAGVGVIVRG